MKRLAIFSLLFIGGCGANTAAGHSGGDGGACMSSALRPSARKDVDAVLVPATRQILVYGGDQAPFDPNAMAQPKQLVDELWRYDLGCKTWEQLSANAPGPRAGYAAAFDSKRNRMVLVGGLAGTGSAPAHTSDVWALDVTTLMWTQLQPSGTAPSARVGHRVIYDAGRDRLILVGGDTAAIFGNGIVGDVWELDFAGSADGAWKQLSASNAAGVPSARRDVSLAIDTTHQIAVMFGGAFSFDTYTDEVWTFDLASSTWKQAQPVGGLPSARFGAKMAFDDTTGQMVLFGGHDAGAIGLRNDSWELTADSAGNAVFTPLLAGDGGLGVGNVDTASPERRDKHGFVVSMGTAWTFGGSSDCGPLDDAWTLDLTQPTTWTPAFPAMQGETCARRAMPGQMCPSDCGAPL